MSETTKTLVQCDFDGTVTNEDVSFFLLDTFANGNWRERLKEYQAGRISVGRFNTEAFAMVKANRANLAKIVRSQTKVRAGFSEFLAYCRRKNFRFVIVSNGLDFYIEEVLRDIGVEDIEVSAARTIFHSGGIEVRYIGPDGSCLEDDFKGAYVDSFLRAGYRILYLGNGTSDLPPARRCHHIFATGNLLAHCQRLNLDYTPFTDFREVIRAIEALP
tara:strand:+ start:3506 stop:4156 length:651 start_codon:yes stop_codon:yes gene_type:complete